MVNPQKPSVVFGMTPDDFKRAEELLSGSMDYEDCERFASRYGSALMEMARAWVSLHGDGHASDCAVHNEPAYPNGPCDCGGASSEAPTISRAAGAAGNSGLDEPSISTRLAQVVEALEKARDVLRQVSVTRRVSGPIATAAQQAAWEASEALANVRATQAQGVDKTPVPLAEIAAERRRQVEVEGWTAEHDDEHAGGELAEAAAVYATGRPIADDAGRLTSVGRLWPWSLSWFKPHGRRRDLIKAGALIIAEIERLDRATQAQGETS